MKAIVYLNIVLLYGIIHARHFIGMADQYFGKCAKSNTGIGYIGGLLATTAE